VANTNNRYDLPRHSHGDRHVVAAVVAAAGELRLLPTEHREAFPLQNRD
jgi:hypothetical protein